MTETGPPTIQDLHEILAAYAVYRRQDPPRDYSKKEEADRLRDRYSPEGWASALQAMLSLSKARHTLQEAGHTGSNQAARVAALAEVLLHHPDAKLVQCRDERTGHRFGRAKCRAGRCQKIGASTFTGKDVRKSYQIWAVWDEPDTKGQSHEKNN